MKGIIVSGGAKTKREIVPSGTHVARCYSMIHIGTVEWEYQGEKKFSNKVRLSFELPNEMRTYGDLEMPMSIDKEYTLSMHEKANLRKDLEMWRGKSFTTQELGNFDVTDLLGASCNLTVIHKTTKAGNEYATIGGLSAITKGTKMPAQFNLSFIFNYHDNFDTKWLDEQPDWIQEQIKSTEEYASKMNQLEFADTDKDDMPF